MGDLSNDNEILVSYPCIRAMLMLFNILFWLSGLALFWMGIWMRTDFHNYLKINSNYSEYAPYVLLTIGVIILFISSLACSCIVKTQPTLLVIYGGFLIVLLYTLISLSVYMYTYKDQLIAGVGTGLHREIANYELHSSHGRNISIIDVIQTELHCCGNESYLDWNNDNVPKSCCWVMLKDQVCGGQSKSLNRIGCSYKLRQVLNTNLTTVGVATSAIALFPLFGTVLAFALALIGGNKSGYELLP